MENQTATQTNSQTEKPKKSVWEWIVQDIHDEFCNWRGGLLGAIVGYIVSGIIEFETFDFEILFYYITHFYRFIFEAPLKEAALIWSCILMGLAIGMICEKLYKKNKAKSGMTT